MRTAAVDVCYSSNVLEHVRSPWTMAAEMVRVTRPGGTIFLSFTPWLSPHGGHETGPWHYLGGHRARRRFVRENGHEPKNRFGESLFAVSVGAALRWARRCPDADLVAAYPAVPPVVGGLGRARARAAGDRLLESRPRAPEAVVRGWYAPVSRGWYRGVPVPY